jgi:hypothetical protein
VIDIIIKILEKDKLPDQRVAGSLDARVYSENPTKEEISIAARILEKLREFGEEIGQEDNAEVKMFEKRFKKDEPK